MKYYVKTHIWELLFTVMISFGLTVNVFSSYVIETSMISNYILIVSAILGIDFMLFVAGFNKRTTVVGIGLFLLFIIAFIISINSIGEALALFWGILILSTVGTYLFSRNRFLIILFGVGALFACAAFKFLRYPVSTVGFFMLLIGLILEILYKVYYSSVSKAVYGNFNFSRFSLQSIAVVTVVMLISTSFFYSVINPLDLPTRELKLITQFRSWDVLEKIGVASTTHVESEDKESSVTNDKLKDDTNKKEEKEDKSEVENEEKQEKDKNTELQKNTQSTLKAFAISYDINNYFWIAFICFIIVLLMLPFLIKFLLRKKQKQLIDKLSPKDGVVYLYGFFLKRFYFLKLRRDPTITLYEYVDGYGDAFDKFNSKCGDTFSDLTDIYVKTVYGKVEPSENDFLKFKNYYDSFFENTKEREGKFKYAFEFWRI